jgi:beta-galactosidase
MKPLPPRSLIPVKTLLVALSAFASFVVTPFVCAVEAAAPDRSHQVMHLYHGAAYYPELWPEADIDRDIAGMRKLGINVVRIGEFAWAKMEPNEGEISLEFFRRVMDKLHAAGIGVVLCTPTATPPIWLSDGHPERAFVDGEDRTMIHGARQHMSYENPDVRAACFRIVEAEAEALGRHPALVAWQIDNELKCHVAEDFNPSAVVAWHGWLAQRYGTIEKLNAAWGTEIWSQHYQRFDQVPAPLRTPFAHNASLSTAYRMFSRERIAEFMDAQSTIIRRYSDAPITHNTMRWFSVNLERLCAHLDFAAFDMYHASSGWQQVVLDCDLFRAAKPGRPFWVMETSATHNGWLQSYEPAHPPGFLVAEAVSAYGLGGEGFSYWLWRQQRTGCELPHSAIESAWFKPTVGYAQVERVEAARRQLEPLLAASRPAPTEVALTWSDLARTMMQTEPLGSRSGHPVDYQDAITSWHALLLDAGLNREIRFEGASFDGLKLLVTPLMPYASPEFLAKVEKFVRAGGVWICGPNTGARTAEHTVPTDAALGSVEALAGIETVYSYPVTGTDARGEAFGVSAPLGGWCAALRPASPETKVVGELHTGLAPGLAFLTERKLGQGVVVVLGAQPEDDEGKTLLTKLVARYAAQAGVTARYEVTPGTLVCARATDAGRTLWIIVNLDGKGGTVKLPQAATDAISGATLPAGPLTLARYEWRAVRW